MLNNVKKIEILNSDKLSTFDRLIPKEGLNIYPRVRYCDVNDIIPEVRVETKRFFYNDQDYKKLRERRLGGLSIGNDIGNRFCVYVYKSDEALGNLVYTELLDNPHGYGEKDFLVHKWIYPPFRGTKYSRYASADMIHILFKSGIANRLYMYVPTDKTSGTFWERMDKTMPCTGIVYKTDGPEVQKYISIVNEFNTPKGLYILIELNGNKYREMDLYKYMMTSPARTEEVVARWIREMDLAANIVKEAVKQCTS